MKNEKTQVPPAVKDVIDMFFAQKKLYERTTGISVPSSIIYTEKAVHTDKK